MGNLFTIQSNGGSTKYLQVASSGVTVSTLTSSGLITANGGISVAANQTITMAGGTTASRPASPTKGTLYYDTSTNQLVQYNGSKWIGDRTTSTKIVAMGTATGCTGTSPVASQNPDGADYVVTSCTDAAGATDGSTPNTINAALKAVGSAGGGMVYLEEGTYIISTNAITIPNNVTLQGVGEGTIIKFADNVGSGTYYAITNSDTTTGTHINIQNLLIDGNKSNQSAGFFYGVYFNHMGSGSGSSARDGGKITNIVVKNLYSNAGGVYLSSSSNNTITGNTAQGNGGSGIYMAFSSSNNTVTGNIAEGNVGSGVYLFSSSSNNTITGNTAQGNGLYGIELFSSSSNNTITGNTAQGNGSEGIELSSSSSNNTITGNTAQGNLGGIDLSSSSSNNTITGNTAQGNGSIGISFNNSSNNTVSSNKVHDNGGSTNNNGIYLSSSSTKNSITSNDITDTSCTTTCYAINISDAGSTGNYLASNHLLGDGTYAASINDATTGGNTYSNQPLTENGDASFRNAANSTTAFQVQDSSGASLLAANTLTRAAGVAGNILKVGNSTGTDTNTTVLVLDSATADPTTNLASLNGGLFYNSTTGKVSIVENGVVKVLCNKTDASCGGNSTTLQQAYDASAAGTTPEIVIGAVTNTTGVDIQNKSSASITGASLFAVRDKAVNNTTLGTALFNVSDKGETSIKTTTNSATAFQVQNSSGSAILTADTQNTQIITATLAAQNPGSAGHNSLTSVDTTGDVGNYSSIALGSDGFARISYYDNTNGDLKFAQCTNAACTTSNITTVDTSGNVGRYTSIAIGSDGFARISYYDVTNGYLKFARCINAACTTFNITTVDTGLIIPGPTSIAVGPDGFARIAYYDNNGSSGVLKFAQCTNDACTTSNIRTVDSTGDVGQGVSMVLGSDGFARISYYDNTNGDLKFAQCTNAACTISNITSVDTTGNVGDNTSIALGSDGFARISYYDNTNAALKFAQCTNATCTTSNIITVDASGSDGLFSSIGMGSDGFARIAYWDGLPDADLRFAQCTNATCSTHNITTVDTVGNVGQEASMAIGSDGFARISYYDATNLDLKFAFRTTADSSPGYMISGSSIGTVTNPYGQIYAKAINLGTFSVGSDGSALFKPLADSASAFQVQNSTGSSLITADTTNMRVSVGSLGTAVGQVYVGGMAPTYIGQNSDTKLNNPKSVYVQGRYAYVANYSNNKLDVYDITKPTTPTFIGENSDSNLNEPTSVKVSGHYAYITSYGNNKLEIYDISNPASPTYIAASAGYDEISGPSSVYVQGRYAFVTGTNNNVIATYDISNPHNPTWLSNYSGGIISAPNSIYVQGNYAYITNAGNSKLAVCNISNPYSMSCVNNSDTTLSSPSSVYVQGRYAYVASSGNNKLVVYDISNPAAPNLLTQNPDTNLSSPQGLYISGRYAYVVGSGSKLNVYDLGGTYTQQLEAGGAEVGSLQVDTNAQIAGDFNVQGALQVGQNIQTAGDLGISGSASLAGKVVIGGDTSQPSIPAAPTVTPQGTGGSQRWDYAITAVDSYGDEGPMSPAGTTSLGNTTLTAGNNNLISWSSVGGAVSYNIYRTYATGGNPSSTGWVGNTSGTTFNDTGINLVGSLSSPPQLKVLGQSQFITKTNSTSGFTLQNSSGATLLTGDTSNMRISVDVIYNQMSSPGTLTLTQSAGGSLTALAKYYYEVTAIDSAGGETSTFDENTTTLTSGNQTIGISWTAVTGASGYRIYRSAANGVAGSEVYLTTVLSSSFTDNGSITAGTATPPTSSSAYTSSNKSNSSLQLSVGGLGTPTGQVYVSGTQPKLVGSMLKGSYVVSSFVVGRYLYSIDNTGNKFYVTDISNPIAPIVVATSTTGINSPYQVYVQGQYAYIVNNGSGTLAIYNISVPTSPSYLGSVSIGSAPQDIYIRGQYAYITVAGSPAIEVYNISNPSSPVALGSLSMASFPGNIYVAGNYAYVTSGSPHTLSIIDISNPNSLSLAGSISTGLSNPFGVYVKGHYAYVTSQSGALYVIDVSTPSSPSLVTTLTTGLSGSDGITIQGRYAYIASIGNDTLTVVDISNPYSPVFVTASGSAPGIVDVSVEGRYAYASADANGLYVFDLGGTYTQQLEAGGAEFGTLAVDSNMQTAGDASVAGGLSVGGGVDVNGNLGLNGYYLQTAGSSASAFLIQNGSNAKELALDTSGAQPALKVYDGTGTNYASISYSGGTAIFAASSGTTQVGSGTGTVTVALSGQTDQLVGSKNFTTASTISYTTNDFDFSRTVSAGAGSTLQGSVMRVQDLSPTGLANTANVLLLNQSDSAATGYLINAQSASSTVLSVDNSGKLAFWNGANNVSIQAAGGTTQYAITLPGSSGSANQCLMNTGTPGVLTWGACGGGSSTATVTLAPEYVNAVMTPNNNTGNTHTGSMTSDFCSGSSLLNIIPSPNPCGASDQHSYYSWTESIAGTNDYDIFVQWRAPTDFSSFNSITFNGWTSTTSDLAKITIYKGSTACGTAGTVSTTATWGTANPGFGSCTVNAGDTIVLDVSLKVAASGDYARAGEINIIYNRK
ncbi:MAG TPA: right-handed parallel beta-helix repeat-containing protein [Candidatus Saccharimonadales bacterium]|nr:right-handed parallel beta-helix repeat-containing protein [Candidatus Saccharimonadales bacterium]